MGPFHSAKSETFGTHVLITLNRPERRNAIDRPMVSELHAICTELEEDPRIMLITGSGPVFGAGADLQEMRERRNVDALAAINSSLFDRIAALPLPTIALVNGPAIGAGAELAYACDFRLAAPEARFSNPEVTLGIMPAAGACWRLRELVGLSIAREVLLAGKVLDADQALNSGLVNSVVGADSLLSAGRELAERLGRATSLALRLTKLSLGMQGREHRRFDDVAQAVLFETPEKYERITQFLERRGQG